MVRLVMTKEIVRFLNKHFYIHFILYEVDVFLLHLALSLRNMGYEYFYVSYTENEFIQKVCGSVVEKVLY